MSTWQALLAMSKQLYTLQPSPLSLGMRDGDYPTTSLARNARRRGFPSYNPPSLARNATRRGSFALQPAPSPPSLEVQHRGVFSPINCYHPRPKRETEALPGHHHPPFSTPLPRSKHETGSHHHPFQYHHPTTTENEQAYSFSTGAYPFSHTLSFSA